MTRRGLKTMAAAAVLTACSAATAAAQGQRSVYSSGYVSFTRAAEQQVVVAMTGTCNTSVAVRIRLLAKLTGAVGEGWGPVMVTVGGNPVNCNGANGTYTARVNLAEDDTWQLERLVMEVKGAWDLTAVSAVGVNSTDPNYNLWFVPLDSHLVW